MMEKPEGAQGPNGGPGKGPPEARGARAAGPPNHDVVMGPADVGPAPTSAGPPPQSPLRNRKEGNEGAPRAGVCAASRPPLGQVAAQRAGRLAPPPPSPGVGSSAPPCPPPGARGGALVPCPLKRPRPPSSRDPPREGDKRAKALPFAGHSFVVVCTTPFCACADCEALKAQIKESGGRLHSPVELGKKTFEWHQTFLDSDRTHVVASPDATLGQIRDGLKLNTPEKQLLLNKGTVVLPSFLHDCASKKALVRTGEQHKWTQPRPAKPMAKVEAELKIKTPPAFAGHHGIAPAEYPAGESERTQQDIGPLRTGIPVVPRSGPPNLGRLECDDPMYDSDLTEGEEVPETMEEQTDFKSVLPEHRIDARAGSFLCAKAKGQGTEVPQAGHAKVVGANALIIETFNKLSKIYKASGTVKGDGFRSKVYKQIAELMRRWPEGITLANLEEQLGKLRKACVGKGTLDKIRELVTTGKLAKYQNLMTDKRTKPIIEMAEVHGIGNSMATNLYNAGARTVAELREIVKSGKTEYVGPGGVVQLPSVVRTALTHFDDLKLRMDRDEIKSLGDFVRETAESVCSRIVVEIMGSYRRGKPSSHDIDFLVTYRDDTPVRGTLNKILNALRQKTELADLALPTTQSEHGTEMYLGMIRPPVGVGNHEVMRRIDFRVYERRNYPFALLHMTGSDHFNRSLRLFAKKKGLKLSDNGLRQVARGADGKSLRVYGVGEHAHNLEGLRFRTEADVFAVLKLDYVPPEERHSGVWVITDNSVTLSGKATQDGSGRILEENGSQVQELVDEATDDESTDDEREL